MSFDSLGLRAELRRAIRDQGYTIPSPVQAQAIPPILAGRDLMAAAQTGTGKTAAFTLPMLQRLMATRRTDRRPRGPRPVRGLVVVPTRELAAQVLESTRTYGDHLPLRGVAIYGGVSIRPQITALRRGVDIVIATPGRLMDHVGQGTVDLGGVEICVLDEADRMLDMGFLPDVRRILSLLPERRQNLLFSATLHGDIAKLAHGLLHDPVRVDIEPEHVAAETVEQFVYQVDTPRKLALLTELFSDEQWDQVLIFTRTKHRANRVATALSKAGIAADAIHGSKSQGARTRALSGFKAGASRALVATDLASRGLDISGLPQVVNYELPLVPEDYVHRIGRTGRAGAGGAALSLVCPSERGQLRAIEQMLGRRLPAEMVEGFELDPSLRHEPVRQGRGGRTDGAARSGARAGRGRRRRAPQGARRDDAPAVTPRDPRGDRSGRPHGRTRRGSARRTAR